MSRLVPLCPPYSFNGYSCAMHVDGIAGLFFPARRRFFIRGEVSAIQTLGEV
jgi:hypothetical protein